MLKTTSRISRTGKHIPRLLLSFLQGGGSLDFSTRQDMPYISALERPSGSAARRITIQYRLDCAPEYLPPHQAMGASFTCQRSAPKRMKYTRLGLELSSTL